MAFIKASHLQANIDSLARLSPEACAEVKRRAASAIATCNAMARTQWAPLALDLEIANAVFDVVGPSGLRKLNSDGIRISGEGPLLRPIRDAARRILGARPDAILRFVHQGWGAIFKDVGDAKWIPDADNRGGVIVVDQQPQIALDSRAWPDGCAGAIEGVYETVAATGTVVAEVDRERRTLTMVCRW